MKALPAWKTCLAAMVTAAGLTSAFAPLPAGAQERIAPRPPDDKPFHVFLMIGQSNMAGRAAVKPQDDGVVDGAFLWNPRIGDWELASPPYNRYFVHRKTETPSKLNPGPSFVRAYLAARPDVSVGIVCAARGGTSIEEWEKGRQDPWPLYDEAVRLTRAALAKGGILTGILWHQGESNSKNLQEYPARLQALIQNLRTDLNAPNVPFVFSQIGHWREDYAAFNTMIKEQPAQIPFSACIHTDTLTNLDDAHFDTSSQRELGRGYAKAILSLQQP